MMGTEDDSAKAVSADIGPGQARWSAVSSPMAEKSKESRFNPSMRVRCLAMRRLASWMNSMRVLNSENCQCQNSNNSKQNRDIVLIKALLTTSKR